MNKETLNYLRIILPGIIVPIFMIPIIHPDLKDWSDLISNLSDFSLEKLPFLIIVLIVGGLCDIFSVDKKVLQYYYDIIDLTLKRSLITPFIHLHPSIPKLQDGPKLMDVFYHLIDKDESLKDRAKDVRMNGLYLSAIADLLVCSFSFLSVYTTLYITQDKDIYRFGAVVTGGLYLLIVFLLLPYVVERHRRLGKRQTSYILQHCKDELQSQLTSLTEYGN